MKIIKRIILVIVLIIVFIGAILTYKGYTLYKQALDEISVADKVAEIKEKKYYTKLEDMPEFSRENGKMRRSIFLYHVLQIEM